MPTTESTNKVMNLLKAQEGPLTPTQIQLRTNLGYKSIKSILAFLKDLELIKISTNGNIKLIEWKEKEAKEWNK